jgi:hypothetical protein
MSISHLAPIWPRDLSFLRFETDTLGWKGRRDWSLYEPDGNEIWSTSKPPDASYFDFEMWASSETGSPTSALLVRVEKHDRSPSPPTHLLFLLSSFREAGGSASVAVARFFSLPLPIRARLQPRVKLLRALRRQGKKPKGEVTDSITFASAVIFKLLLRPKNRMSSPKPT